MVVDFEGRGEDGGGEIGRTRGLSVEVRTEHVPCDDRCIVEARRETKRSHRFKSNSRTIGVATTIPMSHVISFSLQMDPTAKFEQAISLVLLPVSPQLAALHTSRTNSHSQCSCTRCGSNLTTTTRLVRSKRKRNASPSRAILASCSACGAMNLSPIENAPASSLPYGKRTASLPVPDHPTQVSLSSIVSPQMAPSAPFPLSANQPTAKKTNKSGLQEILQRNRDRERKRVKTTETSLSAFLTSL